MSTTPRPPLLIDEEIDSICEQHPYSAQLYAKRTAVAIISRHETARAKDAELIQRLVDAALYIYWTKPEAAKARMSEVLKAAAAAGFKPSEP